MHTVCVEHSVYSMSVLLTVCICMCTCKSNENCVCVGIVHVHSEQYNKFAFKHMYIEYFVHAKCGLDYN